MHILWQMLKGEANPVCDFNTYNKSYVQDTIHTTKGKWLSHQ